MYLELSYLFLGAFLLLLIVLIGMLLVLRTYFVDKKQYLQSKTVINEKEQENRDLQLRMVKIESLYNHCLDDLEKSRQQNNTIVEKYEKLLAAFQKTNVSLAEAKANELAIGEMLKNQKIVNQETSKAAVLAFSNAANKILEEKTERFTSLNRSNMNQLLTPLSEKLADFKKKVEETYDKESKQRFSLESKITDLMNLNQKISEEANNLTQALKGQSKTQGNWGEMILENILEYSGLVKNREYFVQQSYVDDQGKRKQPDVKIKYPDNRVVIIDAKVSLVAYERYNSEENTTERQLHLLQHIRSLKNHIDNLSSKSYEQVDNSLDFVMLFVPIEPAYLTALQYDPDLWTYAYDRRVLLISPTNLIAALKMVSDIWKREYQNQNALEISKRGELLYDKFVSFVEDMENINKHLTTANSVYNKAMDKLSRGNGNLIGQAEKLKNLGLKPKKEISKG